MYSGNWSSGSRSPLSTTSSDEHEVPQFLPGSVDATAAVYYCKFCSKLLDGRAKMLKCLHAICDECIGGKMIGPVLKCECLEVTDVRHDPIVDYPIVHRNGPELKACAFCNANATKYCAHCKEFHCKMCSKAHLVSNKGREHGPNFVLPYPMHDQFVLCPGCCQKNADVYCTQCQIMICSLCHLTTHPEHDYKVLDELYDETQKSLSAGLHTLTRNDEYLKNTLDGIANVLQSLETQKKSVFDQIDTATKVLHDVVERRSLELKKSADKIFEETIFKIHLNEQMIQKTRYGVQYDKELVKTVQKRNKRAELMKLSEPVLKKFKQSKVISESGRVPTFEYNIRFTDQNIINSISTIRNVGKLMKTPETVREMFGDNLGLPISNFDDLYTQWQGANSNNNVGVITRNPLVNEDSDSDSSEYEPLVDCTCCNQWEEADQLMHCKFCERYFHHECHIPRVLKDTNDQEQTQTKWKCTLCKDLIKYAKVLKHRDISGMIPVGPVERVVMERILMEIYCQNDDSDHFRELPNIEIYEAYYQRVISPISLNDVKQTLESDRSYTSLIQFLLDLKRIFTNGLSYYSPSDPYHTSASNLLLFLQRMINKWIPKLRDDNRLR